MDLEAQRRLEALYARVPDAHCKGLCHAACGLLALSEGEAERLHVVTGKPVTFRMQTGTCGYLGGYDLTATTRPGEIQHPCTAYAVRPLICRLYGVAEGLRCKHGCQPERVLSREEAGQLLDEVLQIAGDPTVAQVVR